MSIAVEELVEQLRSKSRVVVTPMREVELLTEGDDAGLLRVGTTLLPWGDRNTQAVASFLKGPGWKYYEREDQEWQATVIRHHVRKMADQEVSFHIEGSNIAGVYPEGAKVISMPLVAERIANVFRPTDRANVLYSTDQIEINALSDVRTIEVPGIPGALDRPMSGTLDHPSGRKVGDLSAGGVRFILFPNKPERAPIVEELWERFTCTNGLTRRLAGSQINLRGRTVPEILDELENMARVVFEGLEESGRSIVHSAQTPIPGATSDFIREVARERGISAATILRLQDRAASLPTDPSVYDVTQIITAMANEEGIPVATRRNLQAIGGDLTIDTDHATHRCVTCERPLSA